jgi:hypothetical protein
MSFLGFHVSFQIYIDSAKELLQDCVLAEVVSSFDLTKREHCTVSNDRPDYS